MKISRATSIAFAVAIFWVIVSANAVRAQGALGTWVKQSGRMDTGAMSMTVEACCNGDTSAAGGQAIGKVTETWVRK